MRLYSFEQMQAAYGTRGLNDNNLIRRKELQVTYPYSVIVEADYEEFDSLGNWIANNIGPDPIPVIGYGKINYDFGFAEYFFANEQQAKAVETAIPHIYTIYPVIIPNWTVKTNGYDQWIAYDPNNKDAFVYRLPDK